VEVVTHRADGAEVLYDVSEVLAKTVGYFALDGPHRGLDENGVRTLIDVRPYQVEGVQAIQTNREEGHRAGLLHVATGLGKSTMDAMDAMQFDRWRHSRGTTRHIFTAHRTELVHQAMRTYQGYFPDASFGLLTGDRKDETKPSTRFTFATLQTLENMRESFRPTWWHRMTVDESHHAPADSFNATIDYFKPESLLGLTGTPFRYDERELSDIFGKTVYSMSLARGMAEGWLANLEYLLLVDGVLKSVMDQEFRSVEALNRALFVPRRNEEIVRLIIEAQRRKANPYTMGFCRDVEHAELIASMISGAEVIHSNLPKGVPAKRAQAYREGKLRTAVSVSMLDEGYNAPRTNILFLLSATDSRARFEQQLGRGMRAAEGKGALTVLDFVGNSERLFMLHGLMREIRQEYRKYHGRPDVSQQESDKLDRRAAAFTDGMGFSFTREHVAIIDRMKEIAEAPMRPKGWLAADVIGKRHKLVFATITKMIVDLRLEGELMQNPQGNRGIYYSPLQQAYIAIAKEYNDKMAKWPTVAGAAEELDMSIGGVRDALKRLGRPPRALRIGSQIQIVPPEDIVALEKDQKVGNRAMSLAEIARRGNSLPKKAKKVIKDLGIVGHLPDSRARTKYRAVDAQRAVKYLLKLQDDTPPLVPAPKGYRSVPDLKNDQEFKGLRAAMIVLGIEPGRYDNGRGQSVRCLSPTEQRQVKKVLTPPPDDHFSFGEVAKMYDIRDTRVARLVEQHDLKTATYAQRVHKTPRPHLGPEALDEFSRLL